MKVKTSELIGPALDWMVAVSLGGTGLRYDTFGTWWFTLNGKDRALSSGWSEAQNFNPSTNWAQGGRLIDREKLCVGYQHQLDPAYVPLLDPATICWARTTAGGYLKYGPTPLIAAMRCLIASKLGDEVDVPEELLCKP